MNNDSDSSAYRFRCCRLFLFRLVLSLFSSSAFFLRVSPLGAMSMNRSLTRRLWSKRSSESIRLSYLTSSRERKSPIDDIRSKKCTENRQAIAPSSQGAYISAQHCFTFLSIPPSFTHFFVFRMADKVAKWSSGASVRRFLSIHPGGILT